MEKQLKRIFNKEYKTNIAKLIISKEKKVSELARDLNFNENTLHQWKYQYIRDTEEALPGKGHQTPSEVKLTKLRRENQALKEERDIFKKALGIFPKASKTNMNSYKVTALIMQLRENAG